MDENKSLLKVGLVALVVALVVALGVSYLRPANVETVREVVKEIRELGALPGPDMYVPYLSVNGVKFYYSRAVMNTATTTVCALRSPAATSTLVSGIVQFDLATSTTNAVVVTLAKATTAFATTTRIGDTFRFVSGGQGGTVGGGFFTISASTTGRMYASSAATTTTLFAPNDYFVVGVDVSAQISEGAKASLASPVGRCNAIFQSVE